MPFPFPGLWDILLPMHLYPLFLSLEASRVLVAGAGKTGNRKIAGLLDAKAGEIRVFDPWTPEDNAERLRSLPGVRVFRRAVQEGDLEGCALVFAATDNSEENRRIAGLCASLSIPCNIADDPSGSTFHVPAHTSVHGIAAAFSTGGKSPALAGRIRKDAAEWLECRYGPLLVFMGRLRPLIQTLDMPQEERGEVLRALVNSDLGASLRAKDAGESRRIIAALLPPSLHSHLEELLHGLC